MRKILFLIVLALPLLGFAQRYVPGVRVTIAPPALRQEIVPHAPSARHQWVAGYWAWRGGRHAWIGGQWALPPAPGYVWEPAAWENQGGAWVFYEGHWRGDEQVDSASVYQPPAPPVQPVVTAVEPPPLIQEVRPAAPFDGAAWIPGYWYWNGGRHFWVAGRYSAQPSGYAWEQHRWDRREDGKWEHQPGHWHPRGHDDHDHGDRDHH